MRILAVDDCLSIRQLVGYVLKHTEGVTHFHVAGSGEEALQEFDSNPYDLLMVDWSMHPMNGETLIQRFRQIKHQSHIPIIVLSAEHQQEEKNKAKSLGANGWICKPFHPDRLRQVIKRFHGTVL